MGHEVTKSNDGEALGVAIPPRAPMVSGLSAAQTKEQSPFPYQQRERGMTQFLRPDSILLSQGSGEQSGKYPRWGSRRGLRLSRVDRGSVRPTAKPKKGLLLDGLGPHCIALRYVDLKTVEAIPDRAHDFVFSWHYGFS